MSDLSDRLRAEARALPPSADPGLAGRVLARLPPAIPAGRRPPLRFPLPLAIAAGLLLAVGAAWALLAQRDPPPPAPVAAVAPTPPVTPPTPPSLSELLRGAQAALPATGELQALRADLAAVAATVRGAVPF